MYKNEEWDLGTEYCLECGEPLYGRADKKFCDAGCRNSWHNHLRSCERQSRRGILGNLSVNYKILSALLKEKRSSCPLDSLTRKGFRPEFVTQQVCRRGRYQEFRCFDLAYTLGAGKLFNLRKV